MAQRTQVTHRTTVYLPPAASRPARSSRPSSLSGPFCSSEAPAVPAALPPPPPDFAFPLTQTEKTKVVTVCDHLGRLKFSPVLPWAFTEHGAIMAANVLNSPQAAQMSVFVVRAFVKMRAALTDTRELARKLAAVEAELKSRLDVHEAAIVDVLQRIMKILDPSPPPPEPPPPEIGFHVKEDAMPYRVKRRPARAGAGKGGAE